MTPDAVERHAASHLPKTLVKDQRIKEIAHADSLFAEMKKLVENGRKVLAWAQKQPTVAADIRRWRRSGSCGRHLKP